MRLRHVLTIAATAVAAAAAQAQQPAPLSPRPFAELQQAVPRQGSASTRELRIRWVPYPDAPALVVADTRAPQPKFEVIADRSVPDPLTRERNPSLAGDRLVVVAVAADGRDIDWQVILDPRIVRAELPGVDGGLTGTVLHRADTEFLVAFPGDAPIAALKVYQPEWDGSVFTLRPVASFPLTDPR